MTSWVQIQPQTHQHAGWRKFTSYRFSQGDLLAPVVVAELNELLAYYCMAFTPANGEENSPLELVALQGITTNAYLHPKGHWMVPYVPAQYRGYPFALEADNEKADKMTLVVNEASDCFCTDITGEDNNKNEGEDEKGQVTALFDGQQLSQQAKDVMSFLTQTFKNRQMTRFLVAKLQQAELLQPWDLAPYELGDCQLPALWRVDEARLRSLSGDVLSELSQCGALTLAYAQLLTQGRLLDLKKRDQRLQEYLQQNQAAEKVDLDQLFGADEDLLKF